MRPIVRLLTLVAYFHAAMGGIASAQGAYPSRPVTLVVGYGAGGATDTIGRALADGLAKELNQTVLVENRPGANSLVPHST